MYSNIRYEDFRQIAPYPTVYRNTQSTGTTPSGTATHKPTRPTSPHRKNGQKENQEPQNKGYNHTTTSTDNAHCLYQKKCCTGQRCRSTFLHGIFLVGVPPDRLVQHARPQDPIIDLCSGNSIVQKGWKKPGPSQPQDICWHRSNQTQPTQTWIVRSFQRAPRRDSRPSSFLQHHWLPRYFPFFVATETVGFTCERIPETKNNPAIFNKQLKHHDKQKTTLPQHQLAIGVMGSFLGKINGDKVGLTREYYRANVKQYNNNAEQQQTMYSYWKPFHKKFMNSIKHYTQLNVPPSPGTWRVFNSYYRTYFRGFSNPQAKSLYAMATSRAYKKDALLPVLDYASKSFTPNTNVTCTSTGCTLLALENIQAGNEITQPFETGSTIYLLQKHGAVHGITSSSASTQNSVAHGVAFAKCTIHFESLATFPDTGGINPTEWECLTTENQEKSAVLKWALRERNVYHENLKMANVALLHNKQDVVSVELLRWYQTELDIFTNEPNNELFENLIQNELKKEKSEVDRKFWAKEALNAFARL